MADKAFASDMIYIMNPGCKEDTKYFPNTKCSSGWSVTEQYGVRNDRVLDEGMRITCSGKICKCLTLQFTRVLYNETS